MAVVNSSMEASSSSTNCHCSFIKLLGMACDLSELSSPDTDATVSLSNDWFAKFGGKKFVPSTGDVAVLIKLLSAFGKFAKFPRNDCILSNLFNMFRSCFFSSFFLYRFCDLCPAPNLPYLFRHHCTSIEWKQMKTKKKTNAKLSFHFIFFPFSLYSFWGVCIPLCFYFCHLAIIIRMTADTRTNKSISEEQHCWMDAFNGMANLWDSRGQFSIRRHFICLFGSTFQIKLNLKNNDVFNVRPILYRCSRNTLVFNRMCIRRTQSSTFALWFIHESLTERFCHHCVDCNNNPKRNENSLQRKKSTVKNIRLWTEIRRRRERNHQPWLFTTGNSQNAWLVWVFHIFLIHINPIEQ